MQKKYGSAYLFSGPSGVGKTTVARIFAKSILCDFPEGGDPCGKCESCHLFERGQHYNYTEMDSASVGGKEDMVKLRDGASYLSVSKKKIILLDECHDISKQGQDVLLDQVERCPEHLIYLFCTTDPDKMQKPLRNRFMHFQFTKINTDLIIEKLIKICDLEGLKYEKEALVLIGQRSEGHVRNAINLIEEAVYLGSITTESVNKISYDYDEEIYNIIANIGIDFKKVMEIYISIASRLSSIDFYDGLLKMINDSVKFLYGYDNFPAKRLSYINKLKDIHGGSLVELLNYLITRDKFIDKIGLQSDLIILHHKFCSDNFSSKETKIEPPIQYSNTPQTAQDPQPTTNSSLVYSDLQKMDILERGRVLRQRRNQKLEQKEEKIKVPETWPLLKDDRVGENSMDEIELSPKEFSQNLIGGSKEIS